MGSFSDDLSDKLLNVVFGKATYTSPACWILLADAAISNDDTGTTISTNVEITGGGYERVSIATTSWASAASQNIENSAAITFPEPTGSWGTVTHWALADASAAGNVICFGSVDTAKAISSGDAVSFNTGDIDVSLT